MGGSRHGVQRSDRLAEDLVGEGNSFVCPNCGGRAQVVKGTYDFIGGVVRVVRDANLTLTEVNHLLRAAQEARRSVEWDLDLFVQQNPSAAPILDAIPQPGSQRLVILLMILTIVVGVLQLVQNAEYHAEDQRQRQQAPAPTTAALSERQVARIEKQVIANLEAQEQGVGTGRVSPGPPAARRKRSEP